jgi:hypothetical protein
MKILKLLEGWFNPPEGEPLTPRQEEAIEWVLDMEPLLVNFEKKYLTRNVPKGIHGQSDGTPLIATIVYLACVDTQEQSEEISNFSHDKTTEKWLYNIIKAPELKKICNEIITKGLEFYHAKKFTEYELILHMYKIYKNKIFADNYAPPEEIE